MNNLTLFVFLRFGKMVRRIECMEVSIYTLKNNRKELFASETLNCGLNRINITLSEFHEIDEIMCEWNNPGACVVTSINTGFHEDLLSVSSNGVDDENVHFFDMPSCSLNLKKNKEVNNDDGTVTVHLTIRCYSYPDDREYITAIGNIIESLGPMKDKYKTRCELALHDYTEMRNSTFWRLTAVPRKIVERIRTGNYSLPVALRTKTNSQVPNVTEISDSRRKAEEKTVFQHPVKFSILVPLYNTPSRFLKEMIISVQKQTYSNWELCLADASDKHRESVASIVRKFAQNDSRIKYLELSENRGISYNTNECEKMATGEYLALLDHDDLLHPSALYMSMKAIEKEGADFTYTDEVTFEGTNVNKFITINYKCDYAKDTLISNNYICHFSTFKKQLFEECGGFQDKYNGSQDHALILQLTSKARKVVHIPEILYFWRSHNNSTAQNIEAKPYAIQAGYKAVKDFLAEQGIHCEVTSSPAAKTIYHVHYQIEGNPKISIIIPNKNCYPVLKNCVDSVLAKTEYDNYEIIVVDNGSTEYSLMNYYEELKKYPNVTILRYDKEFNYAAINNFAVQQATGEYIVFLNNDTEVISPEWITEMLMYAQRNDVGAVGAKLIYPNETIQHAGIIIGTGEDHIAAHAHLGWQRNTVGYMGKLCYVSNVMAVTGACLMTKKSTFISVGGFDEEKFAVAYNDVDYCLKLYKKGLNNVFNPFAELYHYESISRGSDRLGKNKERFDREVNAFKEKWGSLIEEGDPYYNVHLSKDALYKIPWFDEI